MHNKTNVSDNTTTSIDSDNNEDEVDEVSRDVATDLPPQAQSSIIVILSNNNSLGNTTTSTPNNLSRLSIGRLRPPEYSTIVNMFTRDSSLPKYVQTMPLHQEFEIRITPPPIAPTVIQGPPPLDGAPPSYSAIMRLGPSEPQLTHEGRGNIRIQPSPPFIAPRPPPSYVEAQGLYTNRRTTYRTDMDEEIWGTEPLYLLCPSCARMIRTAIYTHRSNLTHFSAMILCLCGCWPCCLLPYCMKSCKTTHHYCPDCLTYLGMYTPW